MLDFKKILILSPHPEDGEIDGGLIQRFLKNKSKCWYVCFTNASQSVKPPLSQMLRLMRCIDQLQS